MRTATIIARRFGSTPVPTRRGIARLCRGDERLDLEQERAGALERAGDGGPHLTAVGAPEELGRIGDADQAGARHLEHTELVGGAEPILHRSENAVGVVAIALELQDAVDEVLQHARAGDGAVLGHVPDQEGGDAALLRHPQQASRRLAHLRDGTGAEPMSCDQSVCTESITQTAGRSRSTVSQTTSSSVSARISTSSQPPSRAARSFTCATDSSPVTRSARRSREIAPSAFRRRVDLPTPGSPPTSTTDAGTSPPPSTRSSSGTPVEMRSDSSATTSTSRRGARDCAAGFAPRTGTDPASIVPNSPQPGQRPSQRPDDVPHSVHTCWTAAGFAMGK